MPVPSSRLSLAGTLALLAGTVALLFAVHLTRDEGEAPAVAGSAPPAESATQLDPEGLLELGVERTPVVAERVERIRNLRFEDVPEPQIADADDLRDVATDALSKKRVQRQLAASDAELKLLGLLDPDTSLSDVATDVTGLAAAYYDPRKDELFLVGDSVPAGPALAEFVLAHELSHALEDQAYGLPRSVGVSDDRTLAEGALVEGTATSLMTAYAARHLNVFALANEAAGIEESGGELPRFAEAEVTFSYIAGRRFVEELLRIAGGDWKLVDFAYQRRLPSTTEQIIHPEKYLEDERALDVVPPRAPDDGWKRVDSGDLGEFATREILREDAEETGADQAAAGWGGDAYRLWARDGLEGDVECNETCRSDYALGIAWRGDDRDEARELAAALREFVPRALEGVAAGERTTWELNGGWAAVTLRGDRVGLGLAPTEGLASRIASPAEAAR